MNCITCGRGVFVNAANAEPQPFRSDTCAASFARDWISEKMWWDAAQQLWLPKDAGDAELVLGALQYELGPQRAPASPEADGLPVRTME